MRITNFPVTTKGSSLIEVLIATFVVGIVVTVIASGMSYSVRNLSEARFRDAGTKLAQDVQDTFRKERNRLGWDQFVAALDLAQAYCFSSIPAQFSEEQLTEHIGQCSATDVTTVSGLSIEFTRDVQVVTVGDVTTVTVVVAWQSDESRDLSTVSLVQELRDWD